MFTLMPRESNFSLLGNINPFLYNELVEKMLKFSAFHKKEKPIHIHFNIALDRMLLRSQVSLLYAFKLRIKAASDRDYFVGLHLVGLRLI